MFFAPINAVDDGIFVYCAIGLLGGYYGHEFYDTKMTLFGWTAKGTDIVAWSFFFGLPLMAVNACYNMY